MKLNRIPEARADFQRAMELATAQGNTRTCSKRHSRYLISCRLQTKNDSAYCLQKGARRNVYKNLSNPDKQYRQNPKRPISSGE